MDMKKLSKISTKQVLALQNCYTGKISEEEFKKITRRLNRERTKIDPSINHKPICGKEGLASIEIAPKKHLICFKGVYEKLMGE